MLSCSSGPGCGSTPVLLSTVIGISDMFICNPPVLLSLLLLSLIILVWICWVWRFSCGSLQLRLIP